MSFTQHNHSIRVPRLPGSLSDFLFEVGVGAVRQTNSEIQRELEAANEGIDHRMSPEDAEEYARCLERAQRKIGVRPFNPPAGYTF